MSANEYHPLLTWLQIAGGGFPTGCFNHSYGLETCIQDGLTDPVLVEQWLASYMKTAARFDAVFVKAAYDAAASDDLELLQSLQERYSAAKPAQEAYGASMKTGRSLLIGVQKLVEEDSHVFGCILDAGTAYHYPIAYGIVGAKLKLPQEDTLRTFLFSGVSSLVSVATRIIPLGQSEAQLILYRMNRLLTGWSLDWASLTFDGIDTFAPGFDIPSMRHETLYSRLCMS